MKERERETEKEACVKGERDKQRDRERYLEEYLIFYVFLGSLQKSAHSMYCVPGLCLSATYMQICTYYLLVYLPMYKYICVY